MFRSRAAQTTILAAGSALALITATAGDRAHAEGNLDASYIISFARIPVDEITATAVFGQNEYAISARARAGGVLKAFHGRHHQARLSAPPIDYVALYPRLSLKVL
jgi:hypothetical protein